MLDLSIPKAPAHRRMKASPSLRSLRDALRYDEETGKLYWRQRPDRSNQWNSRYAEREAFTATARNGYKVGRLEGQNFYAHRIAYAIWHGEHPSADVDHVNGRRDDNRIANLRSVSRSVNQRNKKWRTNGCSGAVGVHWRADLKKWVASIGVNKKTLYLGAFREKAKAIAARQNAEAANGFTERHGVL